MSALHEDVAFENSRMLIPVSRLGYWFYKMTPILSVSG